MQTGAALPSSTTSQTAPRPTTGDESFQGSVPQGTVSPNAIALTLEEAVDRGLKANLGLLTSQQSSREVRAERYRALSGLLPKLTGQLSMTEQVLHG